MEILMNMVLFRPEKEYHLVPVFVCSLLMSHTLCKREETESEQRRYHSDVSSFLRETQREIAHEIANKLNSVLEALLTKLARYDQDSILSSVFALKNPGAELHEAFIKFLKSNLNQIMEQLHEVQLRKYIVKLWYTPMVTMMCEWLSHRMSVSLHQYQLQTLLPIAENLPGVFQVCNLFGVPTKRLRCPVYGTLLSRLHVEESMLKGEQVHCIDYTGTKHSEDYSDSSSEDEL